MTLKIDSWPRRTLLISFTLLAAAGLFRVITSHFITRAVEDRRLLFSREALLSAAAKYPGSARILYRLAESDLQEVNQSAAALAHAETATRLSPWNYQARQLLATAQELAGQTDEAEGSLRAAVRLAPHHARLNWMMANVLLRRRKFDESLDYFKAAVASDDSLLPSSLEIVWQGSQSELAKVKDLVGNDVERQLLLVRFLIEQSRVPEAITIFNGIDREAKLRSPRSAGFMQAMLAAGQYESARSLWLGLVGSGAAPVVWSGGFEAAPVKNFGQFDWVINPNQYARIDVARGVAREGERSLRIAFNAIDTTTLKDQVHQLVVLRPNTRYRAEFYVKADNLVIPEGPRLVVARASNGGVIAASVPISAGTYDWQPVSFEFISPPDAAPKFVSITRIPKFSYDDPASGTVWFDDISLVEK